MIDSLAKFAAWAALLAMLTATPALFAENDKAKSVTFDDLKFEMEKGGDFDRSMLTSEIEALDGKRVQLKGYMLPAFQESGIKNFVLVRDNLECCYGPGAALFDCTLVHMQGAATAKFSVRPITVDGTFRVEEYVGPDGKHLAVFRIDGVSAK